MKMTPRERVMASVNHQNPDSLPMDLGSNVSAGISGMAYGKNILESQQATTVFTMWYSR